MNWRNIYLNSDIAKLEKIIKRENDLKFIFKNDIIIYYEFEYSFVEKINIKLLTAYIKKLHKKINVDIYNYIFYYLSGWTGISKIRINNGEAERLIAITKLFDIKEFEEFKDEFLDIDFGKLIILYDLHSKKIMFRKSAFLVDYNKKPDYRINISMYDNNELYFNDFLNPLNFKRETLLKLLLYIAHKQNNLTYLKNELEKELISGDYV